MATAQATAKTNTNSTPVSKEDVLELLQQGKISIQDAMRMLPKEPTTPKSLTCKVSQKGALSVYGLQRMPVTLYAAQWERLLAFSDTIKAYIASHDAELNRKS